MNGNYYSVSKRKTDLSTYLGREIASFIISPFTAIPLIISIETFSVIILQKLSSNAAISSGITVYFEITLVVLCRESFQFEPLITTFKIPHS